MSIIALIKFVSTMRPMGLIVIKRPWEMLDKSVFPSVKLLFCFKFRIVGAGYNLIIDLKN